MTSIFVSPDRAAGGLRAGTRIATDRFAVAVEDLRAGDLVRTLHAGMRVVTSAGPCAAPVVDDQSVCIAAGAIDDGVPAVDLYVPSGQALFVDGVLVEAGRLVNGISMTLVAALEAIRYFYVELDRHEVIFAETCPVETVCRQAPCLERLVEGFQLHAIQVRLLERAGGMVPAMQGPLLGYVDAVTPGMVSGWAKTVSWAEMMCAIELPVSLDVYAGGHRVGRVLANRFRRDVRDAGYGAGYHGFEFVLPEGVTGPVSVRRSVDGEALAVSDTVVLTE